MVASEERIKVLTMLQEGKITAEDAIKLLEALEAGEVAGKKKSASQPWQNINTATVGTYSAAASAKGKMLHVKVSDIATGKTKVNVRLPLSVVKTGAKMGMKFAPEVEGLMDITDLLTHVEAGDIGRIIDVSDEKNGEHVEIFIE